MTRRRVALVLALVLLVGVVTAGAVLVVARVSTTPQERYCDEVVARRGELTRTLSVDARDGLLRALPIFEDLRDQAPDDLADEWQSVVSALEGLRGALADAGADPATYDREDPPEGVDAADQERIDAAATRVGSQATRDALAGIDQHARDVCGTPLTE